MYSRYNLTRSRHPSTFGEIRLTFWSLNQNESDTQGESAGVLIMYTVQTSYPPPCLSVPNPVPPSVPTLIQRVSKQNLALLLFG